MCFFPKRRLVGSQGLKRTIENTPGVDACAELHLQMKISDLNAPVYYLLEAKKSHIYIKLSENVISSPFSACSWFSKIESMFSKVQNAQLLDFLHMKGSKTLESSILHRLALLRIKNRVPNAIWANVAWKTKNLRFLSLSVSKNPIT